MSSVSDKLKDLGVQVGTSQIKTPKSKSTSSQSLIDIIPGSWERNKIGECFVYRSEIPLGTKHGKLKISGSPDLSFFNTLPHFEGGLDISPEEVLFIDTETTGLSGGVGTYVFLIGVAKYKGDILNFAQFFLQDPAHESSQLAALNEFISNAKLIVSYNGKSFDLPRIKTRYRLHGWPDPFAEIYHIDLLHIARRLWKAHLPGCTLGDLEHHLLGLQRDSIDIPGWQVSEHFYEYLRSGDPTPLKCVFYHNEIDVISLAALLEYISERLSSPLKKKFLEEQDLVSIGKYFFSIGNTSMAIQVLNKTLAITDLSEEIMLDSRLTLAAAYKKKGEYKKAAPLWLECSRSSSLHALVELAKYAEHKLGDYDEAIHWTLTSLDNLDHLPRHKQQQIANQLDHRLGRLKKKKAKQ
jgi:uncharacterized protein YprB with RNaseH-like and TPR domain